MEGTRRLMTKLLWPVEGPSQHQLLRLPSDMGRAAAGGLSQIGNHTVWSEDPELCLLMPIRCHRAVNPEGFKHLNLGFSDDVFHFGCKLWDVLCWAEVGRRKEKRVLVSVVRMFCAHAVLSFTLKMYDLSFLHQPFNCTLFLVPFQAHKRCAYFSQCLLLPDKMWICIFSLCCTRSWLWLLKCVFGSLDLQVTKASVSRQNTIWKEWVITGKRMCIWHCEVSCLIFSFSEKVLCTVNSIFWPQSWALVQYCYLLICPPIHPLII
jgi:hypothetical protein